MSVDSRLSVSGSANWQGLVGGPERTVEEHQVTALYGAQHLVRLVPALLVEPCPSLLTRERRKEAPAGRGG